jgi:hypothetical protein
VSHSLSTHPEHAARMLLLASAVLQTHWLPSGAIVSF